MLNYMVIGTEDLLVVMLATGLLLAVSHAAFSPKGRRCMHIALIAGLAGGIFMTIMKTKTSLVDTSLWNMRFYIITWIAFAVFVIFTILGRKRFKKDEKQGIIPAIALAVELGMLLMYFLPIFFENFYTIMLTEDTILSTTVLYKFIGLGIGVVATFLAGLGTKKGAQHLPVKMVYTLAIAAMACNIVRQVLSLFSIVLAKGIVVSNHTMFVAAKFGSNHGNVFIYIAIVIAIIIPVTLWVRSFHVNEPYSNPAEHRKIRARWRNIRRWGTVAIVTPVFSIVVLTAINAYANQEVELSPIEECEIDDENMYIDFSLVDDGSLHRFGYETENGVTIRVIVIQKPNSSSYGVGLDACDICGETGYYEKDGQVICNLCDVVMNINTIGFKGGCNPIVIDYSIENGQIIIPLEGLLEYESEFE